MKLLGTLVDNGFGFAIYSDSPLSVEQLWGRVVDLEDGRLLFGPEFRLVTVTDEPAPTRIAADLSESLYPESDGDG